MSGQLINQGRRPDFDRAECGSLGYHVRHLFQLLKVKFGDATAFVPQGQLQQGLSRKAFQGPVRIRPEARVSPGVVIPLTVAAWSRMRSEEQRCGLPGRSST